MDRKQLMEDKAAISPANPNLTPILACCQIINGI
jgi:hypothetical protein